MANLTDPLARSLHGTNPQNLIEYITRQKIYDSHFWKDECFGLTAADATEKAATRISCIGGSYGGNMKPTRFISLTLKLLQIQPSDEVVEELIQNEDFKYVRALGMFYLRLTGQPSNIYEKLEPFYSDYRRLRYKEVSGWSVLHIDEFVDQLLRNDSVCGINMPRLPNRNTLIDAGYLEGSRRSAIALDLNGNDAEQMLQKMADEGSETAKHAIALRQSKLKLQTETKDTIDKVVKEDRKFEKEESNNKKQSQEPTRTSRSRSRSRSRSWGRRDDSNRSCSVSPRRSSQSNIQNRDREKNSRSRTHRRDHDRNDDGYYRERRTHSRGYEVKDRMHHDHEERWERGHHERDRRHGQSLDKTFHRERSHGKPRRNCDDDYDKNHKQNSQNNHRDIKKDGKKIKKDKNRYGSLFKNDKSKKERERKETKNEPGAAPDSKEFSEEYWNEERAKLGLKPLKK